jgi:signal transduction histidine kinase
MNKPMNNSQTLESANGISPCDPINTSRAETARAAIERASAHIRADAESQHFHPLEVIPFFRRWPRTFWRNFVYTLILNLGFAALFTFLSLFSLLTSSRPVDLLKLLNVFGWNLIISNVIGFMFWGVLHFIGPVLAYINQRGIVAVTLFYTVMGTCIVTLAFMLLSLFPGFSMIGNWLYSPRQLLSSFIISLVISFAISLTWHRRVNQLAAEIAIAEERSRVEAAERSATEANLRALQAQIEPHFLFNTLANVTSLIHTKPDDAKHMLEEFIAYLRASLATTRERDTTVRAEFALMEKFLSVLRVRMGARLKVEIDVAPDCGEVKLPSMLIQPIVENAIKHGLEPKVEGGAISLSAKRQAEMLQITIADTGLGFLQNTAGQGAGSGVGLANVRERLDKLYNGRAYLSIEDNQPCGTKMTIVLPIIAVSN